MLLYTAPDFPWSKQDKDKNMSNKLLSAATGELGAQMGISTTRTARHQELQEDGWSTGTSSTDFILAHFESMLN